MNIYESLLEVPVDEYHGDDHDDQDVPSGHVPHNPPVIRGLASTIAKPDPNQVVPFEYAKSGDSGPHVLAVVRALSRAGYGAWKGRLFSNKLGLFATRNLNAFKKNHGLPANGVYDKATREKLAPWFDAYAIKYMLNAQIHKPTREELIRNAFVAQLMYLYNRRSAESYTQGRPWDQRKPPWGLDCSASGEWAAKLAGLKRAVFGALGWGWGNTDSQIARFRSLNRVRTSIVVAEPGDPVYYGRGADPSHVAYWLGGGRVWSFGAYPIKILPHDYRHDKIAVCDLMAGQ